MSAKPIVDNLRAALEALQSVADKLAKPAVA